MRQTPGATREAVGVAAVLLLAALARIRVPGFLPDLPARLLSPAGVLASRFQAPEGDSLGLAGSLPGTASREASSWGMALFREAHPPPGIAPGWARIPARVLRRDAERGRFEVSLPQGTPVRAGCPAVWGESLIGLIEDVGPRSASIVTLGRGHTPLPARLHFVEEGRSTPGPRALLRPAVGARRRGAPEEGEGAPIDGTYLDLLEDPRFLDVIDTSVVRVELRTIEPAYLLEGAPILPSGLLAGLLDRGGVAGDGGIAGEEALRCRPRLSPFVADYLCLLVPDTAWPPEGVSGGGFGVQPIEARAAHVVGGGWVGPGLRTLWVILDDPAGDAVGEEGDAIIMRGVLAGRLLHRAGRVAFARGPGTQRLAGSAYLEGAAAGAAGIPMAAGADQAASTDGAGVDGIPVGAGAGAVPCGRVVLRGRVRATGRQEYLLDAGEEEVSRRLRDAGSPRRGVEWLRFSPWKRPLVPPPILGSVTRRPGVGDGGEDGGGGAAGVILGARPPRPGEAIWIQGSSPVGGEGA